jgi:hypothetical protein
MIHGIWHVGASPFSRYHHVDMVVAVEANLGHLAFSNLNRADVALPPKEPAQNRVPSTAKTLYSPTGSASWKKRSSPEQGEFRGTAYLFRASPEMLPRMEPPRTTPAPVVVEW